MQIVVLVVDLGHFAQMIDDIVFLGGQSHKCAHFMTLWLRPTCSAQFIKISPKLLNLDSYN